MLSFASIAINTKCNNSCIWCYDKASQSQDFDISDQTFDKSLSLLKKANCKHLTFLGGEPTLHNKLSEFIHKTAVNNLDSIIVSNGSGYTDSFLRSIDDVKHKVTLNVSIEGATATIHDKVTRTSGSFENLLNGIQLARNRNFDIAAIITLCSANMRELPDVISLLEDMKIQSMTINYANPPLNVLYNKEDYLTVEQFSKQIAVSVKSTTTSVNIAIGPPLPLCQLSPLFKKMLNEQKIHLNNGCQLLFGKAITINAKGDIILCNHLTEVKTGSINDIVNIEDFQAFLTNIDFSARKNLQKYPLKKCNQCDENINCFGGCPLLWLK
jgi:radical SAM protein with 4Fe4S-binding SPASM domain